MTHLIPELEQQPSLRTCSQALFEEQYPELASKPHSSCHPLCPGPASLPAMASPHPQLTTIPTRWELAPCNAPLPCSLHADGHSLCRWSCPSPASLPAPQSP